MSDSEIECMLGARSPRTRGWQPPTPEELQARLPQYEITELLGRGGMGAVYKGWQKSLERFVAIKILPPGLEAGEVDFAARFKREAKAMAKLKHPGIIPVHDAGETADGLLYFVMDYVEGTDLQKLLATRGRLPPEEALPIASRVLDALAYAHQRGIIHRDIKPANIMLEPDGSVLVADFGLARSTGPDTTMLTVSNMAMGTPDFMAPESHLGMDHVDHRADLYAVGVMLYQMLTGKLPRGRFEPLSRAVPGLDKRLDVIVDRTLQNERDARYSSAIELKSALDPVLTRSIAKRKPTVTSTSPSQKKPLFLGGIAIASAALGTAGWFLWNNDDEKRRASSISPPAEAVAQKPAFATGADHAISAATKEAPFTNSLGMKFVPVPIVGGPTGGKQVLFSIWETRIRDYDAFVNATHRPWDYAGDLPQGKEYPALDVAWTDAVAFCDWLTAQERKAGTIGSEARYRLPGDHEWSCAAGSDYEDATQLPREKTIKRPIYPWGTAWPPPAGENARGEETIGHKNAQGTDIIAGHRDPYPTSAPVGLSQANRYGLFDLGGNATEWCEDWYDASQKERVLRGGAFSTGKQVLYQSDYRTHLPPEVHGSSHGFRVVLEYGQPEAEARQLAGVTAPPAVAPDREVARWVIEKGGQVWDPLESTCRHASLSIL